MRKILLSGSAFLLAAVFLLAGCGGGGGGSDAGTPASLSFYAYDFVALETYTITADKVGEGAHCYVYLERGMESAVDDSDIENLVSQFDNSIYPGVRSGFGSEPSPGVDGDSKIYILLMDIKDGFSGESYIAGYFDSYNELSAPVDSNKKEIFYMDVDPGLASSPTFRKVLAHEFQHMIHWNLKDNDDTWLDEAMSEVAPYFAGYGGNYGRVLTFQEDNNRSDSLYWPYPPSLGDLKDYAVVYMWAQYMVDRFPDNVFRNILSNDNVGIASVEVYLNSLSAGLSFSSVFRDWSIAVFNGMDRAGLGNPAWAYQTIDTWAGYHEGYNLPGLFTDAYRNVASLPSLAPWSIDLYWYDNTSTPLTWTVVASPAPSPQASVYDWKDNGALTFDFSSGTPYPYDNSAILILQNTGGDNTTTSTVSAALAEPSATILSPAAKLAAAARSAAGKSLTAATGKPTPVCVHDFLVDREKRLRRQLRENGHAH